MGFSIPRAIPSRPWPGVAALEVAYVWLQRGDWFGTTMLDEKKVNGITSLLKSPGQVTGKPFKIIANANNSFNGSYVLGLGFVLEPNEALALIAKNAKNSNCLAPYLNGEDLNSRPDRSASRWVINFYDWPLNRLGLGHWLTADDKQRTEWLRSGIVPKDYAGPVAADYPDLLEIIETMVKPERTRKSSNGSYILPYPMYIKWWIYARNRPELYSELACLNHAIACSEVTKHLAFEMLPTKIIFSTNLDVFTFDDFQSLAILQSTIHEVWSREYCATLETRLKYSSGNAFETFPFPKTLFALDDIGIQYQELRRNILIKKQEGLTKLYNRFHESVEPDLEIIFLRKLYVEMDITVAAAYGWQDLDLGHGFHETKQGIRYTISEAARREVLDRLLALNHQRHAEEVAEAAALAAAMPVKRTRKSKNSNDQITLDF